MPSVSSQPWPLSQPLNVLVKPSGADCNLDCTYCFYLQKSDLYAGQRVHRMSEEVLDAFLKQYMPLAGPNPSIGWQGGEPSLMGLDFFRRAVELEQKYATNGQTIGNGFQTNGLLIDDDWAEFFHQFRFLIGLSMDGPAEIHNHYRLTKGHQPTHDRVMATVERLRKHRVEFNILVVLNDDNVRRPREIWKYLIDHDLRYVQFIPCVERGEDGKIAPFSVTPEAYGEFLIAVFDEWIRNYPPQSYVRFFDDLVTTYVTGHNPSCILADKCGSYVVVEHNGDVYCCDFFVDPEWKLGNLLETPLAELVQLEQFREFTYRKQELAPECRSCTWLNLCHGGCPKYRIVGHGHAHAPTYFCRTYKAFFAHSHSRAQRLAERVAGPRGIIPGLVNIQPAEGGAASRNAPCPCGSGKKYKSCCMI